jgi:hypothetical protein
MSSAALVVTNFMSDAGLRATSAWYCKRGVLGVPTGNTTTLSASRGNLARCKASSTAAGKLLCACSAPTMLQSKMRAQVRRAALLAVGLKPRPWFIVVVVMVRL